MADVRGKHVPPSIKETGFNCPSCGVLAKQFWYIVSADSLKKDATPLVLTPEQLEKHSFDHIKEPEERERIQRRAERMASGRPFLYAESKYLDFDLKNVSVSQCFNCDEIAIWIYDRLVWPQQGTASLPNPDLHDDVRADYEEASAILDASPRGAAALLRLAVQKLCKHLGEPGENLNKDIASLVGKGLDIPVQQALDVVRVVGNNAVHPGQIDLQDDRATAEKLFGLVNLIAEIMITRQKHVRAIYDSLPEDARKAIEKRNGKK